MIYWETSSFRPELRVALEVRTVGEMLAHLFVFASCAILLTCACAAYGSTWIALQEFHEKIEVFHFSDPVFTVAAIVTGNLCTLLPVVESMFNVPGKQAVLGASAL